MRKQTGYEDDWLNALNGVTNLANTMSRTKATGLRIQNAEDQREQTGRERQGESWGYDYEQVNKGLPDESRISPENFTRSGDTIGLPEKTRGLHSAVTTQNAVDEAYLNRKQNELKLKANQYTNEFSKLSQDDLSRLDPTKYGQDAYAARIAQGMVLGKMGETEGNRAAMLKKRHDAAGQMYANFSSAVKESEQLIRSGDKKTAIQIMANAINQSNNSAYKAKATDNGIQMYITQDGEDVHDAQTLSPEQALERLKTISKQGYYRHFHLAAEDARKQNIESLEKPIVMSDGKDLYQVIKTSDPLSSDFRHEAYSLSTGQKAPYQSLAEMRQNGFFNAKIPGADGKGSGSKNLDTKGLDWQRAEALKTIAGIAMNKGIPVAYDDATGSIVATKPLTEANRQELDKLAAGKGLGIPYSMEEEGSLWWKKPVYQIGGPAYAGGSAMGLRPPVVEKEKAHENSGVGTASLQKVNDEQQAHKGLTGRDIVSQFTVPENAPIRKVIPTVKKFAKNHLLVDPDELERINQQYNY